MVSAAEGALAAADARLSKEDRRELRDAHVEVSARKEAEALYVRLGHLIAETPAFTPIGIETHRWTGKAFALINKVCDQTDVDRFRRAVVELGSTTFHGSAGNDILRIVYRALAIAELDAPVVARGAFIASGDVFDALALLSKIFSSVTADVLIVDPYMDAKVLTDFAVLLPETTQIRLLSDAGAVKPSLSPAVKRWKAQYVSTRSLDIRLAPPRTLHDRIILADHKDAWVLTQSLNAFAERSPASILKADGETAPLKVIAYNKIFDEASTAE